MLFAKNAPSIVPVSSSKLSVFIARGFVLAFIQVVLGFGLKSTMGLEVIDLKPTLVRSQLLTESEVQGFAGSVSYDPVGKLLISGNTASGTLVHAKWVLTAAHVISSVGGSHNLEGVSFVVGGNSYSAISAEVHPLWRGDPGSGYDLALVKLNSNVMNVAPASYKTQPSTLGGQEVSFIGFGLGGTGDTGVQTGSGGVKRGGTNTLDYDGSLLGMSSSIYLSDFDSGSAVHNSFGSAQPTLYESVLAPGDSGGGVFMNINGEAVLVGVNSFVASFSGAANSGYGNVAGFQAIQPHLAWVQSLAHAPEPTSLVLGIISAIVVWWFMDHQSSRKKPTGKSITTK